MNSSNEITITASEPTTMTSSNELATTSDPTTMNTSTTTATTKASATNYSYRPRNDIKTPPAFPVAFSPLRNRSTKRTNRGYKDTATVKMPVKVKRDNVSKTWSPATKMTAEQEAGIRAVRLEARRLAKGMQGCEAVGEEVVDEDSDGEVGEV